MTASVIDVNVLIVANGYSPQADNACVEACAQALIDIVSSGIVVLDGGLRIFTEYMRNLNMRGQPGLGDHFMRWVWENQAVESRCERVVLTQRDGDPDDFNEFPKDPNLARFDRSDRKYVAVALASRLSPTVLNAVDPDWWEFKTALELNGVKLTFLCLQHMGD
ncbi:MAG: hypothetical protein WC674_07245 [Candidatus Krumholzibacteriia bacterium]